MWGCGWLRTAWRIKMTTRLRSASTRSACAAGLLRRGNCEDEQQRSERGCGRKRHVEFFGTAKDLRRRKRRRRRRQAVGGAVGGGRNRVRTSGGGGVEAIMKGWATTRRGGATVWTAKGGGGSVVKLASTQDAHLRLSIGDGVSGRGVPSASWTIMIRSPEHSMTGDPVAADAATAEGSSVPNMMANVAARNASDRFSDQCSEEDEDTALPYWPQPFKGRSILRGRLSGPRKIDGFTLTTAAGSAPDGLFDCSGRSGFRQATRCGRPSASFVR